MNDSSRTRMQELVDPHELADIDDLELIARWVVEGFLHGLHRSPYVGFSVDFASHREYVPGDDLRHLNWKLYGRQQRLYIKQYDAETNVDLHLVLDVSSSMTAGAGRLSKQRYAAMLAASLAHLAASQRDAVGLTLFADRVVEHYSPRGTSDHLLELLAAMSRTRSQGRADSIRVLHEVAELMPRRGLVVLISDFYFELDELLSGLDHFRHFGHDVLLFHVLDPLEHHMDAEGAVQFIDLETGAQVSTLAHEIRASYTAAVATWTEDLKQGCLARDVDYVRQVTDRPLEQALFDYLAARSQMF